jgi:hypothetical protein
MSIDDIRHEKGIALLEFQEAERRVRDAHAQLKHLSGTLDRVARLLDPDEEKPNAPTTVRTPNLNALQDGCVRKAMDYGAAIQMATDMADAMKALSEAQTKKRELGV